MWQSRQGSAPPRATEVPLTRRVDVVRTYLALDDRSWFRPPARPAPDASFEKRAPCPVPKYRELYSAVGGDWFWHDRLEWSDRQLEEHLARDDVGVWEAVVGNRSAGYFELQRHADGAVEIVYFGLTPEFMGHGIGGAMLEKAVHEAWRMSGDTQRVWLHTCTLDSEHALPNYKARGFREFRTERLEVEIDGKTVVSERIVRG